MRLIVVVGCPGSGKTSLALELGRKLALPVVHLDVLYWRPGWKACDKASFRVRVAEAIRGDGWVVDGSFSELALDLTLARADTLLSSARDGFANGGSRGVRPSIAVGRGPTCLKDAPKSSIGN